MRYILFISICLTVLTIYHLYRYFKYNKTFSGLAFGREKFE